MGERCETEKERLGREKGELRIERHGRVEERCETEKERSGREKGGLRIEKPGRVGERCETEKERSGREGVEREGEMRSIG